MPPTPPLPPNPGLTVLVLGLVAAGGFLAWCLITAEDAPADMDPAHPAAPWIVPAPARGVRHYEVSKDLTDRELREAVRLIVAAEADLEQLPVAEPLFVTQLEVHANRPPQVGRVDAQQENR